ncbi:hypothetical protein ACI6Q2_11500 [Chitinophagaceae bacterium LWZ2-11]
MGFFDKLFKPQKPKALRDLGEDYKVTITDEFVTVEYPETEQVMWEDIQEIKLINTDAGPWQIDIWLSLSGKEGKCLIPMEAKGYDEVYEIVSKYEGFNFENVGRSMTCTDNAEFLLWRRG